MYSEVSGIFNRAERVWREVFKSESFKAEASNEPRQVGYEAYLKKRRNWTEEDFLWCWQHRGFW